MSMDGANRNEAVSKFKAMMTPEMVAKHMAEKHVGQPAMSVSEVHAMIEKIVQPTI